MKLTYTIKQVADLFQWSQSHFRSRRPKLENEQDFPRKLPGTDRYSAPMVDAWFHQSPAIRASSERT